MTLRLPTQDPLLSITHPVPSVWIIELHHGEDNRLTENFIRTAIFPALDHVELTWRNAFKDANPTKNKQGGHGALIITGKRCQEKFFSNGFDYPYVVVNPGFVPSAIPVVRICAGLTLLLDTYNSLLARLLTFPIPTVAAINGHVFAAGFVTALACDYRVITSDKKRRVWGCMNEVHFGASLAPSFSDLLRAKVSNQLTLRKMTLEGHRFTPAELLAAGLVDSVVDGGTEVVLAHASELAEKWSRNARMGVWGLIRQAAYREVLERITLDPRMPSAAEEEALARARL